MNRRTYLSSVALGISTGITGCAGGSGGSGKDDSVVGSALNGELTTDGREKSSGADQDVQGKSNDEASWPMFQANAANTGVATAKPPSDGVEKWRFESDAVLSSPVVANGAVFVGCRDKNVYALSAVDGTTNWTFPTDDIVTSTPTVVDGTVFIASWDNNVYALSTEDGTEKWRFDAGGRISFPPVVGNDRVFVGTLDGVVYSLARNDGSEIWTFETDGESALSLSNDSVFACSHQGTVYAINADQGGEKWRFEDADNGLAPPAVAGGTLYTISQSGIVYALSAADGTEKWGFGRNVELSQSPAVTNSMIYIGSRHNGLALSNEDGSEIWRLAGDAFSSPAVAQDTVFFGDYHGYVYALSAGDGTEKWTRQLDHPVEEPPAIANGTLYVVSGAGDSQTLYAIN